MKILRKSVTGVGITLIAGAAIAVGGASPALAAAGFTLFNPGFPVGAFSPPVGAQSVPVGARSAPRCVDIRTPRSRLSVGSASSPQPCVTITTGGATGGPVGTASPPRRCVVIATPRSTLRNC